MDAGSPGLAALTLLLAAVQVVSAQTETSAQHAGIRTAHEAFSESRLSVGFYAGYRFPHFLEETTAVTTTGDSLDVVIQVDGGMGTGLIFGKLWPVLGGRSCLHGYWEVGFYEQSVSYLVTEYGLRDLMSWYHVVMDSGARLLIPIHGGNNAIFLSPAAGFGVRAFMGTKAYSLAAFYGVGIDILGRGRIGTSLDLKATYSQLFMSTKPFMSAELRLTFYHLED